MAVVIGGVNCRAEAVNEVGRWTEGSVFGVRCACVDLTGGLCSVRVSVVECAADVFGVALASVT